MVLRSFHAVRLCKYQYQCSKYTLFLLLLLSEYLAACVRTVGFFLYREWRKYLLLVPKSCSDYTSSIVGV